MYCSTCQATPANGVRPIMPRTTRVGFGLRTGRYLPRSRYEIKQNIALRFGRPGPNEVLSAEEPLCQVFGQIAHEVVGGKLGAVTAQRSELGCKERANIDSYGDCVGPHPERLRCKSPQIGGP